MNMLSVLIYFANILPNIGVILVIFAAVSASLFLGWALISAINNNDRSTFDSKNYDENYTSTKKAFKSLWIPALFLFVSVFLPSTNTVYLIAASEIAEEGYKSEVGQKLTTVINEKLDEYIQELSVSDVSEKVEMLDLKNLSEQNKKYLLEKLGVN